MFVPKSNRDRVVTLQLVLVLCLTTLQVPSTCSLSIFDYYRSLRNSQPDPQPAPARVERRLENDYTRFRFGLNFARMFQDLVRKFFSTIVTINVNVMGEQVVHVPKPTMDLDPSSNPNKTTSTSTTTSSRNQREETIMRLARLHDVTEAPVTRRVPLIKRMLGIQNGPMSSFLTRRNDERRALRPFSIFGGWTKWNVNTWKYNLQSSLYEQSNDKWNEKTKCSLHFTPHYILHVIYTDVWRHLATIAEDWISEQLHN